MFKFSPSEFDKAITRLKDFSDNSTDVTGFKISDDLFVLYNPILQYFSFSSISSENTQNTFEFDDVLLTEPDFSLSKNVLCKVYKTEYYQSKLNTGHKNLDSILQFIVTNELVLYFLIFLFMCIGPVLASAFKLVGGAALFLCLFTFFIGVGFFAILNNKR